MNRSKIRWNICAINRGFECMFCFFIWFSVCNVQSRYRTSDGSCNNLANTKLGMARTPLRRVMHNHYDDGKLVKYIENPKTWRAGLRMVKHWFLDSSISGLQQGSKIRICLDFQWSQRDWVENGVNFEWNLKSRSPTIWNLDLFRSSVAWLMAWITNFWLGI